MKQKLIASLQSRIKEIAPQSSIKFIKNIDFELIYQATIKCVYLYTRKNKKTKIALAETTTAIGSDIRQLAELKKDSGSAAKVGAFLLYSFEECGLLHVVLSQGTKHATYFIEVDNDDALNEMWEEIPMEKSEKFPSLTPPEPWTSTSYENLRMIKTMSKEVLRSITPESHPMIYESINRAQNVGWRINTEMLGIFEWALKYKTEAFNDIWEMQSNEAKSSKLREAKAILSIAKKFRDVVFYHRYYLDFRYRRYPATAYLHEQGVDAAKGLLLRADKRPLGEQGFYWLLICIASNWAGDAKRSDKLKTDKIPLKDRVQWSLDNEEILLSYAESPKINQGWMQADAPWSFLAGCIELRNAREHEEWVAKSGGTIFDYECSLEGYIDGSCNGMQHLAAMTKDEKTAPHVNLIKSEFPGDLYRYVGDHVWNTLEADIQKMSKEAYTEAERTIANVKDYRNRIAGAENQSDRRKALVEEYYAFKEKSKSKIYDAAPVYWHKITDAKDRRKIVKRNTMTISYGATPYGMGSQQKDDARKHGIVHLNQMETAWATYMGRLVFEDCKVSLKRPMRVLAILEAAGKKIEEKSEFLKWRLPITNALVVQHYEVGDTKEVRVQYGDRQLQLSICFKESPKYAKGRQAVAAAPNLVHSLDAAHLMITVNRCDFTVSSVHDAYGCLFADMPKLYSAVRKSFVELYSSCDVLEYLGKQVGADLEGFEYGTYDVVNFLDSEYGFC